MFKGITHQAAGKRRQTVASLTSNTEPSVLNVAPANLDIVKIRSENWNLMMVLQENRENI